MQSYVVRASHQTALGGVLGWLLSGLRLTPFNHLALAFRAYGLLHSVCLNLYTYMSLGLPLSRSPGDKLVDGHDLFRADLSPGCNSWS